MADATTPVRKGWRTYEVQMGPKFSDKTPCEPTRFFDQMCYIGDHATCCFLLETDCGLVLIDCLWPDERSKKLIEEGIAALGHEVSELKHIVITHGHHDHYGAAAQFRAETGCKLYMSEIDNDYAKHPEPAFAGEEMPCTDWNVDEFLVDDGILDFGNTRVTTVHTPGHTPGCMSLIIDVTDAGVPHRVLLWGGTGILPYVDPDEYIASLEKFEVVCADMGVDCYVSNHPFVDLSYFKIEIVRNIVNGVNNPFVATPEDCRIYLESFREKALVAKEKRGQA